MVYGTFIFRDTTMHSQFVYAFIYWLTTSSKSFPLFTRTQKLWQCILRGHYGVFSYDWSSCYCPFSWKYVILASCSKVLFMEGFVKSITIPSESTPCLWRTQLTEYSIAKGCWPYLPVFFVYQCYLMLSLALELSDSVRWRFLPHRPKYMR